MCCINKVGPSRLVRNESLNRSFNKNNNFCNGRCTVRTAEDIRVAYLSGISGLFQYRIIGPWFKIYRLEDTPNGSPRTIEINQIRIRRLYLVYRNLELSFVMFHSIKKDD